MHSPRGAVVRRMRMTFTETTDDGSERKRSLAGSGIIVRVRQDSESRRSFRRFCSLHRVVLKELEHSNGDGTYNPRTGKAVKDSAPVATVFQCIADGPVLDELKDKPFVAEWTYAVAVRVPMVSGGSGTATPHAERAIRDAKRQAGERFADVERAESRPFVPDAERDQLRQAANALGIDVSDTNRMVLLGELVRLAVGRREEDAPRIAYLRSQLGI